MSDLFSEFKTEAKRLAKETLDSGGRVALYDYRDLNDPYTPVEHCNFENCTNETFISELDRITLNGGGDNKESLLSASFHVMKTLKWKFGSTKSLVVLTDDGFLSPDRDGVTIQEVIKLSKEIDPVNFYIVTNNKHVNEYQELADATNGRAVVLDEQISLLTDQIMERFDSLPRVEETTDLSIQPTNIIIDSVEQISTSEIKVKFSYDGLVSSSIVILDDEIRGKIIDNEIIINNLKPGEKHILRLVPIKKYLLGDGVDIVIQIPDSQKLESMSIPKAPNAGLAT